MNEIFIALYSRCKKPIKNSSRMWQSQQCKIRRIVIRAIMKIMNSRNLQKPWICGLSWILEFTVIDLPWLCLTVVWHHKCGPIGSLSIFGTFF